MKRRVQPQPKLKPAIQLRPNERDERVLEVLREKNPTLKDAQIVRLALDALAEKQGLLSAVS